MNLHLNNGLEVRRFVSGQARSRKIGAGLGLYFNNFENKHACVCACACMIDRDF